MTHPPAGPSQPPRPSGPKQITPLDPDSPAGRAAAEAISRALAEIAPNVRARRDQADGPRS